MLSKVVSSSIFKVFGMTRPGIEPRSPGPLANTLTAGPMSRCIDIYSLYIQCRRVLFLFIFLRNINYLCHVSDVRSYASTSTFLSSVQSLLLVFSSILYGWVGGGLPIDEFGFEKLSGLPDVIVIIFSFISSYLMEPTSNIPKFL